MKEVVEDEIETEIVASRYYHVYAESYAIHDGHAREDENPKSVVRSRKSSKETSDTKTVTKTIKEKEAKNPKKLALRNLKRHSQRISKSMKAMKNPFGIISITTYFGEFI